MRRVGSRTEQPIVAQPSGPLLAEAARLSESLSALAPAAYMPKGLYRYKSHEEANQHQQDCLARAMALLAASRRQSSRG